MATAYQPKPPPTRRKSGPVDGDILSEPKSASSNAAVAAALPLVANPRHSKLRSSGGFDLLLKELYRQKGCDADVETILASPRTDELASSRSGKKARPPLFARVPATDDVSTAKKPPPRLPLQSIDQNQQQAAALLPKTGRPPSSGIKAATTDELSDLIEKYKSGQKTARMPSAGRRSHSTPTGDRSAVAVPRCMSPDSALKKFSNALTPYERQEIISFPQVLFCGGPSAKKILASPKSTSLSNYGYDDDKGDYKMVMDDHVAYRYQILGHLGRGSFGQVVKCVDHKTNQHVALKIIKNKKKFHEQALIEIRILKHIGERSGKTTNNANVVRLLNSFMFRQHQVLVFELHGISLYDVMKEARFTATPSAMIRHYAKQILETLVFSYREKIVHCDLKPENILLAHGSKTNIRVIDFGSSCFQSERLYTYIQSRFYRAPEIMLGIPYTPAIDMWSLGCILAELSNGYPLLPGESEVEQLQLIMQMFGVPPTSMLNRAPRKKHFFDASGMPKLTPNSKNRIHRPNTKELRPFIKSSNEQLVDLIRKMLVYEPDQRISPQEALRHPFFDNGDATPTGSAPSTPRNSGTSKLLPYM